MIIDTHAHLFYDEIVENIEGILERAKEAGVEKIIVPSVDIPTALKTIELSEKYECIYAAVGFHPCDIKDTDEKNMYKLEELIKLDKVIAIGEIGLDFYRDKTYNDKQKQFFKIQIELAIKNNLPVIIHTRDSLSETIEIVENFKSGLKGQFHCFSGGMIDLERILKLEKFYVSYCGNITFKKFEDAEVVKNTPVERLLSETDTPYLSPEPYRGKKNEPSRIIYTLKKISEIKEIDYDLLLNKVYENANNLFFQ